MCTTVFIDWLYIRPPVFNSVLSIRGQRCSIVGNRVQLCCTVFCHRVSPCSVISHYVQLCSTVSHWVQPCSTVFCHIPLCSSVFHRVLSYPTVCSTVFWCNFCQSCSTACVHRSFTTAHNLPYHNLPSQPPAGIAPLLGRAGTTPSGGCEGDSIYQGKQFISSSP